MERGLRNMLPSITTNDAGDHRSVDTILDGEGFVSNRFALVPPAYLRNLSFGKLCISRTVISWALAGFLYHIRAIFGWRTKEKMRNPNAPRVVAMMTNFQAMRDWAVLQLPSVAMRQCSFPVNPEPTVAANLSSTFPLPTSVRSVLVDFFPETLDRGTDNSVPQNEAQRFASNPAKSLTCLGRKWSVLTATALAVTVWDFVRGIIEGHSDLHSRCVRSRDVDASPAQLVGIPIIPQMGGAF